MWRCIMYKFNLVVELPAYASVAQVNEAKKKVEELLPGAKAKVMASQRGPLIQKKVQKVAESA
jgi:hypothetical protein